MKASADRSAFMTKGREHSSPFPSKGFLWNPLPAASVFSDFIFMKVSVAAEILRILLQMHALTSIQPTARIHYTPVICHHFL